MIVEEHSREIAKRVVSTGGLASRKSLARGWGVLLLVLALSSCAGPSPLRRGVDEFYNNSYVRRPITTQCAYPLIQTASLLAHVTDMAFVNPWYFWGDASRGQGTPYYFSNPVVGADEEEEPVDE